MLRDRRAMPVELSPIVFAIGVDAVDHVAADIGAVDQRLHRQRVQRHRWKKRGQESCEVRWRRAGVAATVTLNRDRRHRDAASGQFLLRLFDEAGLHRTLEAIDGHLREAAGESVDHHDMKQDDGAKADDFPYSNRQSSKSMALG